ncbi:hypothetical protein HELRODRAFT_172506 [Helobdella robusta]|uniref:RING-type E3 ubiquitin transferase n=1 Tax=Helobdella robusta TaxID=6412 RepID=T1F5F3_HELRO|nr:hypothetical protein HELRODRAFT_172506 [Helobdella robusta]ESO04164.1 hypothetical protein HELRODRAFT_172506 [Helobdella robusta]
MAPYSVINVIVHIAISILGPECSMICRDTCEVYINGVKSTVLNSMDSKAWSNGFVFPVKRIKTVAVHVMSVDGMIGGFAISCDRNYIDTRAAGWDCIATDVPDQNWYSEQYSDDTWDNAYVIGSVGECENFGWCWLKLVVDVFVPNFQLFKTSQELYYEQLLKRPALQSESWEDVIVNGGSVTRAKIKIYDIYIHSLTQNRRYLWNYIPERFKYNECCICVENFQENTLVHELRCTHVMHPSCIRKTSCPPLSQRGRVVDGIQARLLV